ncbi:hypothetical protein 8F11_7 [uncultured Caudovirales phage]|uniref:Uncharacterized protein n=1 Tax=uncultured Caudovirales phage TaxID=2100421 RepID=A0A2H4IZL1_9CAUD|nr:hypothetical protein 8F11_7 [uncultured Caudovirales phage]
MKSRIAKIVRKADADNEMRRALLAEQDYELASLHSAMQSEDQTEIERSKKRLSEIHLELAELS